MGLWSSFIKAYPNLHDDFWSMTLKQYWAFMKAYGEKQREDSDRITTNAWLIARLSREDKLQPLDKYISREAVEAPKAKMTEKQKNMSLLAALHNFKDTLKSPD